MPHCRVFGVADNEAKTRFSKFKMADPKYGRPCIQKRFQFLYN